jgi:GNAT superfamily N-acetyltransferase
MQKVEFLTTAFSDLTEQQIVQGRQFFDCGELSLNHYLQNVMRGHDSKGITKSFILLDEIQSHFMGYYSLTHCSFNLGQVSQSKGYGRLLIAEIYQRALLSKANAGCVFIVVDALNESARAFYLSYGFESSPENPMLLYMSV